MYGIVLIAAMTSAGPGCHCQSGPVLCCPVSHGCCGVIQWNWIGSGVSGTMATEDSRLWNTYLEALSYSERADLQELWKSADDAGRLKLIAQVKAMRPPNKDKDREADREVRRSIRPTPR